jgi:hypothetical protein
MMLSVDSVTSRRVSKGLLGNSYRLEIAAIIAQSGTDVIHAKELSDVLRIPHNVVSKQLHAFVVSGVLESVEQLAGQRYRYFRRLPHPYWNLAKELASHLEVEPQNLRIN